MGTLFLTHSAFTQFATAASTLPIPSVAEAEPHIAYRVLEVLLLATATFPVVLFSSLPISSTTFTMTDDKIWTFLWFEKGATEKRGGRQQLAFVYARAEGATEKGLNKAW